ncbi:tetratricopeptide repeat protein [Hyalangium sp.]|uniref:tetratricopeptide repeat protein n=1 Tax=Hyalangium sp. TaxID=2028555 RepID=UPI002D3E8BD4|nr:tetratricopeptide repeat protein [Hyalangium sp.]HYI00115.1 tetratricopeptide repeat protein [Hyalangium sp.]
MTSSHGPGGKSPPGPVKIHRFEKKHEPRRGAAASREYEGSVHERPTLPEFSLKPRQEGAAAPATTPREPPRAKERGSPARGTPAVPTAAVEGSEDSPLSGLMAERMATARSLFAQGQLTQARGILEKLVARGVAGAAAHSLLGTIYMAQGTLERALECFEEALARDPEDLSVRLHRGEVRMEKGDLLLAQQDLQHVLDMGTAGSPLVQQARRLLQQIDDRRNRRRR